MGHFRRTRQQHKERPTTTIMEPKLSLILLIVTIFASKVLSQPAVPRSVIEANSNRGQQEREPLTLYDLHRMLYKRNADLLSDPRFINCIEEMNGAVDNQDAMAFYAKCFSFVGRPRFGKRGMYKPLREGKRSSGVRVHYEEPSQYYEK